MAAIGIIMHKILRIIYGMLKHRKNFDPQVDQTNRNKKVSPKDEKREPKPDKNRRYQSYDPDAPISQRQFKKRQEIALKENPKEGS